MKLCKREHVAGDKQKLDDLTTAYNAIKEVCRSMSQHSTQSTPGHSIAQHTSSHRICYSTQAHKLDQGYSTAYYQGLPVSHHH